MDLYNSEAEQGSAQADLAERNAQAFLAAVESHGLVCTRLDGAPVPMFKFLWPSIYFTDRRFNAVVEFETSGLVATMTVGMFSVPEDKRAAVLEACNSGNNKFGGKFYISTNNLLCFQLDAFYDSATDGETCVALLKGAGSVVDQTFDDFLRL